MKKTKNKKNNLLKSNYIQSWKYIKETSTFIWVITGLFLIFALIGFFIPIPDVLEKTILDYIREILEKTSGMSTGQLILFIFFNNLQAGFFGLIFGFLIGIFPLILTIANGYVLGYVASVSVASEGAGSLLSLLPHGIFELPAIIISLAMGLKFGMFVFQKDKEKSFKKFFINSLRVFVFLILPLLIIAAIIEGGLIFFGR